MRVLIQRVKSAEVSVAEETIGSCATGLLLFLGVTAEDAIRDADYLIEKCLNLRIFPDEKGRFDRSLLDIGGELLVVSQFTLFADTRRGRRPDFGKAADPKLAEQLYDYFVGKVNSYGVKVATGRFGADMSVSLINDGPVTIMLDSEDKYPKGQS